MFLFNAVVLVLVIASNILCQQATFVCTYSSAKSWIRDLSESSILEDLYKLKPKKEQIDHLLRKISKKTDIMKPIGKQCSDDYGAIIFRNCDTESAGYNQYVMMLAPCEYNTALYYVCGCQNDGFLLVVSEEREELLLAGNKSDIAQSKVSAQRCLEEKFDIHGYPFVKRLYNLSTPLLIKITKQVENPVLLRDAEPSWGSGSMSFRFETMLVFLSVALVLASA